MPAPYDALISHAGKPRLRDGSEMAAKEEVEKVLFKSMSEVFGRPVEEFAENPGLRLREDLTAKSMEYFPLIAELEDGLGIQIEYHDFQTEAQTVGKTVEYVCALAQAQGK